MMEILALFGIVFVILLIYIFRHDILRRPMGKDNLPPPLPTDHIENEKQPFDVLAKLEQRAVEDEQIKAAKEVFFSVFKLPPLEGMRALATKEVVSAYKTLMDTLSPEEQKTLNDLLEQRKIAKAQSSTPPRKFLYPPEKPQK